MTSNATADGFRAPMLATATTSLPKGSWIAEEKYDGHRLIVNVTDTADYLKAWSRAGNERDLPTHLRTQLNMLPPGLYDGELVVPHGYSSSVSDLSNQKRLEYVLFDILRSGVTEAVDQPWIKRRFLLEKMYAMAGFKQDDHVKLAPVRPISTWKDVEEVSQKVWDAGGEGLILKDTTAPYKIGKRTKTFLKIKECQPAVLTVIGFAPSEGEIMELGDFGTVILKDADGIVVPVKVLDTEERNKLAVAFRSEATRWEEVRLLSGKKVRYFTNHPAVGRKLHIEFQNRTPDGSYRHPRWDRWDSE